MTRVQYFTATTLDGFIADDDNSLEWLFASPHGEDDGLWDEFIEGVGVLAMGATTYEWVLEHEKLLDQPDHWQAMYGDRPSWIFTHRDLPAIPGADLTFVQGKVSTVFEAMSAAAGTKSIWVIGGGDLVGQFDDVGLLDEIWLGYAPVFLGSGAPLLPRRLTSDRLTVRRVVGSGPRFRVILDVKRRRG